MPDHSYYLPDPRGRSDLPPRVTEWPLRDFPALTFLRLCLRLHNVHAGGARTNSYTRARSIAPRRIRCAVSATREVPSSPSPVNTPAPEVTAVCTKTLFNRACHSLARGGRTVCVQLLFVGVTKRRVLVGVCPRGSLLAAACCSHIRTLPPHEYATICLSVLS